MVYISLNNIKKGESNSGNKHDEVKAEYNIFNTNNGEKLLQIDTMGSSSRKIQGKVSQSMQLDNGVIKKIYNEINFNRNKGLNKFNIEETRKLSRNALVYINKFIKYKGFVYDIKDLNNFTLSLKTKSFVILARISGTGKSELVKLFDNDIGANSKNGKYNIISVKSDWNNSSELFSYKNINAEIKVMSLINHISDLIL